MLLSHTAAYAVRALIWLACQPRGSRWLATDIARMEGIPQPYLSKVLGVLKSQGLISSTRGPKGGYVLVQTPESITLKHATELFDTEKRLTACVFAYSTCGRCDDCPFGDIWDNTHVSIRNFLETTTIEALAERSRITNPARSNI